MSRSSRPGLSVSGYAVAAGLLGFGAGVLRSGSVAEGLLLGLAIAAGVVFAVVALALRRSR
ncbi:MAG: hypothetical protein V5A28_15440 [Haloarculaceae archaeon]